MTARRFLALLLTMLLAGAAAGCGSDRDKGINRGKDLPTPPPAEDRAK